MSMSPALTTATRLVLVWLILLLVALATRPLLPVDETRYVSVAWEMWTRGDLLVPHLNGAPYSHKPPLLFWLINAGWWLCGVQEWSARLVAPLFGLATVLLSALLARRLWPDDAQAAHTAPWLLLGTAGWALYGTLTGFDTLLAFFTVIGAWALHLAWGGGGRRGWPLFAMALGGGLLAKGPAILVHLLPLALLAPGWAQHAPAHGWRRWYLALSVALGGGLAIALLWAIPAAVAGGPDYREAIFWGQTAGRVVKSFAHQHPWWWYLPLLPLLLFPWLFWGGFWRALGAGRLDPGERFCLAWALPVLVIFSLISGKQLHYLLPAVPAFALFFARRLSRAAALPGGYQGPGLALIAVGGLLTALSFFYDQFDGAAGLAAVSPLWGGLVMAVGLILVAWRPGRLAAALPGLALTGPALVTVLHLGVAAPLAPAYDLSPVAGQLAARQAEGKSIAYPGKYHAEYHFLGRLRAPLVSVEGGEQLRQWAQQHGDGVFVLFHEAPLPDALQPQVLHEQAYRSKYLTLLPASTVPQALDIAAVPDAPPYQMVTLDPAAGALDSSPR